MDGTAAYHRANEYRQAGNRQGLEQLYADGDAAIKEAVLNALWGEPGPDGVLGPVIVELALQGTRHPAPGVRTQACYVFQNQSAWGVDVSAAIEPLRELFDDPQLRVRQMAAYAVGNVSKRKYDLSRHVAGLTRLLRDESSFVREPAAWALWQLSKARHDIGAAVSGLVWLLGTDDEFDRPRKAAAGALLHHARKSAANAAATRRCVATARLEPKRKEVKRFLEQLAAL